MKPTDEQPEPLANQPANGHEADSESSEVQPIKPAARSMFDAPIETEQSARVDPLIEAEVDVQVDAQDQEDPGPAAPTKVKSKAKPKAKPKGKATEQAQSKLQLDALANKYAQSSARCSEARADSDTDSEPAVYDEIEPTDAGADSDPNPAGTDQDTAGTDQDAAGTDQGIAAIDQGAANHDQDLADNDQGDPYGGHSPERLKNILEAALFASGTTLSASHLRGLFELHERPHGRIVRQLMAELIAHYSGRGLLLVEVASGYRFQTATETASWVARLWQEKPQRYSRALMETIALVAYRQPITRGEIENVRGVAVSSNIIRTLLEREWVRVVGHRDVPGRPAMYATTRQFLDYFSLMTLDQMPSLGEIRDMEELNPQMPLNAETDENDAEDKQQAEISFSGLIDKIRDSAVSGKTGNEFIDEQLDQELQAMDNVNANFEQALAQQKAEHEHPDLKLDYDDSGPAATKQAELELAITPEPEDLPAPTAEIESELEPPLSEEEQWKSIQQKLAQQQALLDARENDSDPEENDNE